MALISRIALASGSRPLTLGSVLRLTLVLQKTIKATRPARRRMMYGFSDSQDYGKVNRPIRPSDPLAQIAPEEVATTL